MQLQLRAEQVEVFMVKSLFVFFLGLMTCGFCLSAPSDARTRTYYIAADEVLWNYAPSGRNLITDEALRPGAENRIGNSYDKAIFNAYTDATFAHAIRRAPWQGILGPTIRAEVGDTIVVVFANNTRFPQSMHPHGVLYAKSSEGAPYNDGVDMRQKGGDSVAPHQRFRYIWTVPPRAGPAQMDASSVLWMYHSHVHESADISSGLIGPLVVTRKGMARADGSPKDVDRELFMLFALEDENQSVYMADNFKRVPDRSKITPDQQFSPFSEFYASNEIPSINGYIFGNMPLPTVRLAERVRWYLLGNASDALDYHAIHWHGNTATAQGMRTDVVPLLPGGMAVADMIPDNPGIWLFHCHIGYHMNGGMVTRYRVTH